MTDLVQLGTGMAFLIVALLGSVYAYETYRAFRHDIMNKVFGLLSAAFFLLGGMALVLVIAAAFGLDGSLFDILIPTTLVVFALMIAGMIPAFRWIKETKEGRSAQ